MKKAVAIILLAVCLSLCCACETRTATDSEMAEQEQNQETFVALESGWSFSVVYDKQTRVMYCMSKGASNSGNLSPLYNADGTLRLYEK